MPEAKPSRDERGERGRDERRGPEVEPRQDDRAERERGEGDEAERSDQARPPRPERDERDRDADDHRLAEEGHQRLEADAERLRARIAERGNGEHGQRARRVLEREVAVGQLPVVDLRAVALVDRRVDDRVVRVEATVQHGPADEEEHDRGERRRDRESGVSRPGRALGLRCHSEEQPAAAGAGPGRRRRRRGRTTGCRGRTSASA